MPVHREVPPAALERPRLLARLDDGSRARLTLVTGPSGAGKSVLLRQWSARRGGVPWVRAEAGVVDGVGFGRQLVAAVAAHHPGFGGDALCHLLLGGERMGPAFLEALQRQLDDLPDTVIVVEDLHELPAPLVGEIGALVSRGAGRARLLVSSRTRPPMALSRLRAQGRLTEVPAPELAFTPEEAGELVARVAGVRLEHDHLRLLHDRTEGWALGVGLAALALRGGDVDGVLRASGGLVRQAGEFLADEVVAMEAPEVRAFLRQTSMLERLDPDLCDALLGRTDSRRVLLDLERRNLFVVALDDRRGAYRYHPLFARLLRDQLAAEDPSLLARQLTRAAAWHLERDEPALAVAYLLRAERWDQVLDTVAAGAWAAYAEGEAMAAIRWLEAVPADVRRAHGRAEIMLIGLHRLVGNHAVADRLLEQRPTSRAPGARDDVAAQVLSAGGVLGGRDPAEALAHAEAALAGLAQPPPRAEGAAPEGRGEGAGGGGAARSTPPGRIRDLDLAAAARLAGGRALHLLGRCDPARRWLEAATVLSPAGPAYHLRGLAALAHLEADVGHLEASYAAARRAERYAGEVGLRDPTPLGEVQLALGRVSYEQDDLLGASAHLREADALVRANHSTVLMALVAAARAEVAGAQGLPRAGLDLLGRAEIEATGRLPAVVAGRLLVVKARLLLVAGDRARARQLLAAAAPAPPGAAAVEAQLAADDPAALSLVVGRWPATPWVRDRIQHRLWRALVAERSGDVVGATTAVLAALRLAEVDGHRRALLDGGPAVSALLESVAAWRAAGDAPGDGLLRELSQRIRVQPPGAPAPPPLAEPLTPRELEVLGYLVQRLTVAEIAARLGVSSNTLKTHLKRAYRKLGVGSRRAAVEEGARLGLLDGVGVARPR